MYQGNPEKKCWLSLTAVQNPNTVESKPGSLKLRVIGSETYDTLMFIVWIRFQKYCNTKNHCNNSSYIELFWESRA